MMGCHSLLQVLSYCKGVMISLPWSDYIMNATMLRQRGRDSLLDHEEVSCHIVRKPCGKELQVASRGWEWPSTNSQQENKILISTAPKKLMLPTAWQLRSRFFPGQSSRWSCHLANILTAGLWDPEQRTQQSHAQDSHPQKLWDSM